MATAPLAQYRKRFEAMVERLRAHPDIVLLNLFIADPVSKTTLASVEKKLSVPLDPAIAAFYQQCDGLSLRWISKRHPDYDPEDMRFSSKRMSWENVVATDGAEDGCICILPFEQALVKASWKEQLYFEDDSDEEQEEFGQKSYSRATFNRALRPFDYFSFYNMMGFALLPDAKQLPVIMGDDHGACWTDSRITDFASYMETVLATYGSVEARRRIYGETFGHRKKPLTHSREEWEQKPPSLDKLLEEAEENWP
jgi:hypothetical protein